MIARPRIVVDATAVGPAGKGIARVQRETVRALAQLGRLDLSALVAADVELGVPATRVLRRPAVIREQLALAWAARRADAVLTWTDRLPLLPGGRFVVWLFEAPTHRMRQNRLTGAGGYQRASDLLTLALWSRSLDRAARVLAGSRATAAELVRPGVTVVQPGLGAQFSPGPGRDGRYVLHIGSTDPRDETDAVIETVARANMRLAEPVRLLVAGTTGPSREAVEFLGRVSDEELVALYRGAAAYLDASRYEGFGYQPLEAMACGAPVIASDTPAAGEVVGDAGVLCAVDDLDGRAEALVRILDDSTYAAELRERGLRRAGEFTWERTAEQLASVLEEVAR